MSFFSWLLPWKELTHFPLKQNWNHDSRRCRCTRLEKGDEILSKLFSLLDEEFSFSLCKPKPPDPLSYLIIPYQIVTHLGRERKHIFTAGKFFFPPTGSRFWCILSSQKGSQIIILHEPGEEISRDFSTTSILNVTLRRVTKTIWKMSFHSLFSFSPSRLCPKFQHIETFFSLIRGTYKVKGWKGNLGAVPRAPHTIYSLVDEAFSIPPNFQGKQTQTCTQWPGTSPEPLFNIEIPWILCYYYNCCCCLC